MIEALSTISSAAWAVVKANSEAAQLAGSFF